MFGDSLNLRRLRLFVELAKIGNVRRAAAQLNIEQTSLTRSLAHLERDVGHRLFDRQPKGMALTKAGSSFEDFAASILAQLDGFKICSEAHEIRNTRPQDTIRIGISSHLAPVIMPSVISADMLIFPRKRFAFIENDDSIICDSTARGELDACITCGTSRSRGLISHLLSSQQLVYICPSRWTAHDLVSPQTFRQIVNRPLILPSKKNGVWRAVSKEMLSHNIPLSSFIEATSLATTKALIMHGRGATISLSHLYKSEALSGRVQIFEISHLRALLEIYISTPEQATNKLSGEVHSWLSGIVREEFINASSNVRI